MIHWWGNILIARPRAILAFVVVAIIGAGIWGLGVMNHLSLGGFTDPDSESTYVDEYVEQHFGRIDASDLIVLYRPQSGQSLDALGPAVAASLEHIPPDRMVATPRTYWSIPNSDLTKLAFRSTDGSTGLATFAFSGDEDARIRTYLDVRDHLRIPGVEVRFGGIAAVADAYNQEVLTNVVRAELVSFPLMLILLLFVFGGFVAAAVPLAAAGLSLLGAFFALRMLQQWTEVSAFAANTASLIGLGLAVDYSLFMVSRFREELRAGSSTEDAVRAMMVTAGRTVATSAVLLACGSIGMMFFDLALIRSLAYGGLAAMTIAVVVCLTVLPATLLLLGPRINALAWRRGVIDRVEQRSVTFWGNFADRVLRRPVAVFAAVTAVLAVCLLPLSGIKIGDVDHNGLPSGAQARVTMDQFYADFPLARTGAKILAQHADGTPASASEVAAITRAAERVPGVFRVEAVGGPDSGVIYARLTDAERSPAAQQTVDKLRAIATEPGTTLKVGGTTAVSQDGIAATKERIPAMLGFMVLATFLVLLLSFGSVVLAVKAVLMAAISLGATYGVLTWIFVDGHGAGLLGITPSPMFAPIALMLSTLVFGLSSDYEVFLLSRMVESHVDGDDTDTAIRNGIAHTGRVVTAAAFLLVAVTVAFSLTSLTMIRLIGVGVIVGLLIDATIVRMLLVPASVKLMGRANWWAPGPLAAIMARAGHSRVRTPAQQHGQLESADSSSS
ncbi:MMPL family transporter [Nocardia goodfellowii]